MNFPSKLLQIRYYFGENSSHDEGLGVAPVNLSCIRDDIERNYSEFRLYGNHYLIEDCSIELTPKGGSNESKWFCTEWGNLGLRLIGESPKKLKKCAQHFHLPFNKDVIVPYNFIDDLGKLNNLYL